MADERRGSPQETAPDDPTQGHTPDERIRIGQASGFQTDKNQAADGAEVIEAGGAVPAVPPQTALPPEEQGRDRLPGPGR